MENSLEFRNIERLNHLVSADMYINGNYVVKLSDHIENIMSSSTCEIKFLSYFYVAMRHYLTQDKIYDMNGLFDCSDNINSIH